MVNVDVIGIEPPWPNEITADTEIARQVTAEFDEADQVEFLYNLYGFNLNGTEQSYVSDGAGVFTTRRSIASGLDTFGEYNQQQIIDATGGGVMELSDISLIVNDFYQDGDVPFINYVAALQSNNNSTPIEDITSPVVRGL